MKFYDFKYDGIQLSEIGFIVCTFGDNGLKTLSSGSQISFNTISTHYGEKHELTSIELDDCIQFTLQICKNTCQDRDYVISEKEYKNIIAWLNRKEYHQLFLLNDKYRDMYFEASFNLSRIEIDGDLCGLELNVITNRPYGIKKEQTFNFSCNANEEFVFYNTSEVEGHIYPKVEIAIMQNGNLDIHNITEDRHTYIKNCIQGETITLDYPIISSSLSSHKVQNDFNWDFFRLVSTFREKQNKIKSSLACTIKITYSPMVKVIM